MVFRRLTELAGPQPFFVMANPAFGFEFVLADTLCRSDFKYMKYSYSHLYIIITYLCSQRFDSYGLVIAFWAIFSFDIE